MRVLDRDRTKVGVVRGRDRLCPDSLPLWNGFSSEKLLLFSLVTFYV